MHCKNHILLKWTSLRSVSCKKCLLSEVSPVSNISSKKCILSYVSSVSSVSCQKCILLEVSAVRNDTSKEYRFFISVFCLKYLLSKLSPVRSVAYQK